MARVQLTIILVLLAILALGSADQNLKCRADEHEADRATIKSERHLTTRMSYNSMEETKYITQGMRQGYKSNAQLYEAMQQLHVQYPTLTRVFSIGQSANGTAIMALELSAQAGVDEQHEPHVKLVANMHGNEPSGRELLLRFAVMLLSRHGADPLVTALLEHTHVFIVPTLNPDGFTLGRRGNINRIDLNRNFPDQFLDPKEDLARRQPETRALMEFTRQYPFVLSANMHEGDLVVNYPFDGTAEGRSRYSRAPDDELFQLIAKEYARHNPAIMKHRFHEGITNGADWYPLNGGMQDWNYIWAGCFEVTIEASMDQFPPASELEALWQQNNRSLLAFTALSPSGMHGQIIDSRTSEGIAGSTVRFVAPNTGLFAAHSTSRGYFRRPIMPGEYTVEVSAPAHYTLVTNITVAPFDAANDFTNVRNRMVFALVAVDEPEVLAANNYVVFVISLLSLISLFFVMGLPLKQRLTRARIPARGTQIV